MVKLRAIRRNLSSVAALRRPKGVKGRCSTREGREESEVIAESFRHHRCVEADQERDTRNAILPGHTEESPGITFAGGPEQPESVKWKQQGKRLSACIAVRRVARLLHMNTSGWPAAPRC